MTTGRRARTTFGLAALFFITLFVAGFLSGMIAGLPKKEDDFTTRVADFYEKLEEF